VEEECECEEEGGGEWMATFADLSTLLLTFFVLLLSFSNMDVKQFREMLGSVQDAFGVQKQIAGSVEAISSSPVELSMNQNDGAGFASKPGEYSEEQNEMMEQISQYVENQNLQDDVEVKQTPRGVVVRVKEGALYGSGSSDLDENSKKILDKISKIHGKFAQSVQIEGHTDNIPIKSKKFPSNWELSTARAIAAMNYMSNEGGVDAGKIGVAGYADSKPIDTNDTPEGRARNRRIEFVFTTNGKKTTVTTNSDMGVNGDDGGGGEGKAKDLESRAFALPMSARGSGGG
jgi:chemotaxis protein MotB